MAGHVDLLKKWLLWLCFFHLQHSQQQHAAPVAGCTQQYQRVTLPVTLSRYITSTTAVQRQATASLALHSTPCLPPALCTPPQ
jgi:hypothetical protein